MAFGCGSEAEVPFSARCGRQTSETRMNVFVMRRLRNVLSSLHSSSASARLLCSTIVLTAGKKLPGCTTHVERLAHANFSQ